MKNNKITYCIPSKNNLRYLKNSIKSIQLNSILEHDIIVFIDGDEDGTEKWCVENNISHLKNSKNTPQGIAIGYNKCIQSAKTDIVCMFHADMYMAKGFDTGILKYLQPKSVVCGTRIEPPLHPEGKEKIIKNFGMYPEDFDREGFDKFTNVMLLESKNKTTRGIFAPWAAYREALLSIGAHDESFHSYYEDSDIFNRLILSGYEIVQSWEAYVYHLTCRGGQFQDGVEHITNDPAFHLMKEDSMKCYLRKWGSWIKNDEYQYPIITPKHNIGAIIHNINYQLIELLEPWFSCIYVDDHYTPTGLFRWIDYVEMEGQKTKYNMRDRVKDMKDNVEDALKHDVLVEFDASRLTNESFDIIQNLNAIIQQTNQTGEFELDIFKITINNITELQNNLIINTKCSTF